jgi:hypothetical protein
MKPIASHSALSRRAPARPASRGRRAGRLDTLKELYQLLVQGGRWWLVPMIAVLALTAALLVAVAAVEYVAPFVYTIF